MTLQEYFIILTALSECISKQLAMAMAHNFLTFFSSSSFFFLHLCFLEDYEILIREDKKKFRFDAISFPNFLCHSSEWQALLKSFLLLSISSHLSSLMRLADEKIS